MSGVLSGVRIVELASWTYVPSAGAALSDWGADVSRSKASLWRSWPGIGGRLVSPAKRPPDADFILELGNRGKRSIAIDVKSEVGRELFAALLASADVFLTNWLPGALERARLTVEESAGSTPRSSSPAAPAGVRGPDRDRGGFDAATYLAPWWGRLHAYPVRHRYARRPGSSIR